MASVRASVRMLLAMAMLLSVALVTATTVSAGGGRGGVATAVRDADDVEGEDSAVDAFAEVLADAEEEAEAETEEDADVESATEADAEGEGEGAGAAAGRALAHRAGQRRAHKNTPMRPSQRHTGCVQYSAAADKYVLTKTAVQYTGYDDSMVAAWAVFDDTLNNTGWGELTVTSSAKMPDEIQAYAAGYAEGALTAQRIYELFVVIHDVHAKKPEVAEFIAAQDRFIRSKIAEFDVQHAIRKDNDAAKLKREAETLMASLRATVPNSLILLETANEQDADADAETESETESESESESEASAEADSDAEDEDAGDAAPAKKPFRPRIVHTAPRARAAAAATPFVAPASAPEHVWTEFELVYWFEIKLIMAQFDGLLAGYNEHRNPRTTKPMNALDLWLVNNDGDILDIERAVSPGRVFSNPNSPARQELIELLAYNSRCSVMVKWTGDDLLAGHATWDDYNEMNRIYKFYHFKFSDPLHASALHSQRTHMSSYPGMIFSSDDFYVLDSGLVLLETTLNILNEKLYSLSDPRSTVMAWIRNIVANRLASTGREWTALFGHYNSGTYNNQWMVLDYKLFEKGAKTLSPGTMWLFEQIPGFTKSLDVTSILEANKYWASYNRPFFQETNEKSMFEHFAKVEGATKQEKELFSYSQCPRARLFAREAAEVTDLDGLKAVLRLNQFDVDEISDGCPGTAIAARYDLKPTNPKCDVSGLKANGATDAKVTNAELAARLEAEAVGGPSDDDQEPFNWKNTHFKKPAGQPDLWDFDWKLMKPATKFW